MAWSPYKDTIIDYVSRHPGCSKMDVAMHVTWNRQRNPSKQYYIVNTAIRNNWIIAEKEGGRYFLYTPEDYQVIQCCRHDNNQGADTVPNPLRIAH